LLTNAGEIFSAVLVISTRLSFINCGPPPTMLSAFTFFLLIGHEGRDFQAQSDGDALAQILPAPLARSA
jgi:hypothetical protein